MGEEVGLEVCKWRKSIGNMANLKAKATGPECVFDFSHVTDGFGRSKTGLIYFMQVVSLSNVLRLALSYVSSIVPNEIITFPAGKCIS